MSTTRRPLIAGNWKMNLTLPKALTLTERLVTTAEQLRDVVDVAIFPPTAFLAPVCGTLTPDADGTPHALKVGAQNLHPERAGAYTGEVSGAMIREVGCGLVLCGHSERRQLFGESPAFIGTKVAAAFRDRLTPVLCVGETLEEREAGETVEVVTAQLAAGLDALDRDQVADTVIAYEPVWAIGTGRTASPAQAQEVHAAIRAWLASARDAETAAAVRILYGGSVKPDNAAEILSQPDVDGALVGGASLEAAGFIAIIRAAIQSANA